MQDHAQINIYIYTPLPVSRVFGMYPAAPIKESTLLVNTIKMGSYDYLSKNGSDWLGHVTHLLCIVLHSATQCTSIQLYYYTVLHNTFLLLHGCYAIQLYYYTGATQYISITTPYNSIATHCYISISKQYTIATSLLQFLWCVHLYNNNTYLYHMSAMP